MSDDIASKPVSRGNPTWVKGMRSPNEAGRKALPLELRKALSTDALPMYRKAQDLAKKAEADGDIKTAAYIWLALLRKVMPDQSAASIDVVAPDGIDVRSIHVPLEKLQKEDLAALKRIKAIASGDDH